MLLSVYPPGKPQLLKSQLLKSQRKRLTSLEPAMAWLCLTGGLVFLVFWSLGAPMVAPELIYHNFTVSSSLGISQWLEGSV